MSINQKKSKECVLRKEQESAIVQDRKTLLSIFTRPELQNDLKNLVEEKMKKENVYILIDGSASMGGEALDNALVFSCLFGDVEPQINLWGNRSVVKNWVNPHDVTSLARASDGLSGGTNLAPALLMVLNDVSTGKGIMDRIKRIIIVSDGDVYDLAESKAILQAISVVSPKLKIDILIGTEYLQNQKIEKLQEGFENINVIKFDRWNDLYTAYYKDLSGMDYISKAEANIEKEIGSSKNMLTVKDKKELQQITSNLRAQFNDTNKQLHKMSEQINKLEKIIGKNDNTPIKGCCNTDYHHKKIR